MKALIQSLSRAAILSLVLTSALTTASLAGQTLSTKPDGHVTIRTSTTDVTRIAIADDRIRRFVNAGSQYEMTNDEDTGDAFLRFVGAGLPEVESGFVITEKGHTLNYTFKPRGEASETALVKIKVPQTETGSATTKPLLGGASAEASQAFGGDGHAASLTDFVRTVIKDRLTSPPSPKAKNGAVVGSATAPGLRARILVGAAGKSGHILKHQTYYRAGVLSVWIDKVNLAPGERTWIIVLERRS